MFKNLCFNILVILLTFPFAFSASANSTQIRKLAWRGEFPSVVSIQTRIGNGMGCLGTLITMRHVLSVAHCFPIEDLESYIVIAGTVHFNTWDDGCQTRSIVKTIPHYGFKRSKNPFGEDDLAIHFLDHEFLKTYFIRASNPHPDIELNIHTTIKIVALGKRKVNQTYSTCQLEYANGILQEFCGLTLGIVSEKIICLEEPMEPGFRLGLGSAGAPAFIGDKIVALATRNSGNGSFGLLYLNISYYDGWMKYVTRDYRAEHIYGATLMMFILCMGLYILIFVLYSVRNKF